MMTFVDIHREAHMSKYVDNSICISMSISNFLRRQVVATRNGRYHKVITRQFALRVPCFLPFGVSTRLSSDDESPLPWGFSSHFNLSRIM